jgi:hypothetical protein
VNRILQFYDSSMTVSLDPGHLSGAIQSIWLRGSVRATGAPTEKDPLQEGVPRSGNHVQALSPAVHAIKFCLLDDRDHRIARQPGADPGREHRPTGGPEGRELSEAQAARCRQLRPAPSGYSGPDNMERSAFPYYQPRK